jgi:hypothetical protein
MAGYPRGEIPSSLIARLPARGQTLRSKETEKPRRGERQKTEWRRKMVMDERLISQITGSHHRVQGPSPITQHTEISSA